MISHRVSVSVDEEHLEAIGAVADALRSQGMEVEQVMGNLGIISGVVAEGAREALRGVEGVMSVDEAQGFQLAPPESPIQ
jgi:hypothetical protein